MSPAISRIILYLAVLLAPYLVIATFHLKTNDLWFYNLGRSFAQLAFAILALQVVLGSRLKWVERPFGLNVTFPFHKRMGTMAAILLLLHPPCMALGGGGWHLVFGLDVDWWILVGKAAWVLLFLNVGLSLWRVRLEVKFENWRLAHDILGPLVLGLAFVHSWYASEDLAVRPMQVLWMGLFGVAVLLFVFHRLVRPWLLRNHPYRVLEVKQETPKVWTIKFGPPPGERRFDFLPGQFQFVTLLRGRGLPQEEHHFTISSSPTETGYHASTIKESGDFTASIGQTRVGDIALVQAPFGRFSHVLHPEARDLGFIAGGIGITPLMSNLDKVKDWHRRFLVLGVILLVLGAFGAAVLAATPEEVIKITAKRFEYNPKEITLKKGVPVVLEFTTLDRLHGFKCVELGVRADIKPGQVARVPLTPQKVGDFEFHCDNFCGSGHGNMSGMIHVVE